MDKLKKCEHELHKLVEYNYELENQIQHNNEHIEYQRTHDLQTGILNGIALTEILESGLNYVYILLNIDNFSSVNSAYGYDVGNEVLLEVVNF